MPDVDRNSSLASMLLLARRGFTGRTFLDVGAAEGRLFLTRRECNLFPEARHFFIDALAENEPIFQELKVRFGTDHAITAVASLSGETYFDTSDVTTYGCHIVNNRGETPTGQHRRVPVTTIDLICEERKLPPPYIMNLDLQGAEVDALRGATKTLEQSSIVVTEVGTLFDPYFVPDMIHLMYSRGLVLFDITDQDYRPSDQSLNQCYMTFIPKRLDFRPMIPYAVGEALANQDARLLARREQLIAAIRALT